MINYLDPLSDPSWFVHWSFPSIPCHRITPKGKVCEIRTTQANSWAQYPVTCTNHSASNSTRKAISDPLSVTGLPLIANVRELDCQISQISHINQILLMVWMYECKTVCRYHYTKSIQRTMSNRAVFSHWRVITASAILFTHLVEIIWALDWQSSILESP